MRQNLLGATHEVYSQRDELLVSHFCHWPHWDWEMKSIAWCSQVCCGFCVPWHLLLFLNRSEEIQTGLGGGTRREEWYPLPLVLSLERVKVCLCSVWAGAASIWSILLQVLDRPFTELHEAVSGLEKYSNLGGALNLSFISRKTLPSELYLKSLFLMGVKYSVGIFKILTFSWITRQLRNDSS